MIHYDLEEQELLCEDRIKEDEKILGESLNIPCDSNYIPRNKLHRTLAAHENAFRKKLYEVHDNQRFLNFYREVEKYILYRQRISRSRREVIETVTGNFDGQYILRNTECNVTYPNFALATFGQVSGNRIVSQVLENNYHTRIPVRDPDFQNGHSEVQIFNQMYGILLNTEVLRNSNFIVLDIHSTLSMCENCYEDAEKLIKKFYNAGKKLQINFSFNAKYGLVRRQDGEKIIQKQIELIDSTSSEFNHIDPQFINNTFISSGSSEYSEEINVARNSLLKSKTVMYR